VFLYANTRRAYVKNAVVAVLAAEQIEKLLKNNFHIFKMMKFNWQAYILDFKAAAIFTPIQSLPIYIKES